MKIGRIVQLLLFQNCSNVMHEFSLRFSKVPVIDKSLLSYSRVPNCRGGVIVAMGW